MSSLTEIASWSGTPRATVIFVHGLGGHPYDTWSKTPADHNTFWPVWLAEDKDLRGLNIYTVGYEAPAVNWLGSAMALEDLSNNIEQRFYSHRLFKRTSPIIFICHSLGGLVVKQILRDANEKALKNNLARNLAQNTRGIAFIATPHTGSMIATVADWLRFIVWPSASTKSLAANGAALRRLAFWYRGFAAEKKIKHRVFFENNGFFSRIKAVTSGSADAGVIDAAPIALSEDHFSTCKPENKESDLYVNVRKLIEEATQPTRNRGQLTLAIRPHVPPSKSPDIRPILLRSLVVVLLLAGLFVPVWRGSWHKETGWGRSSTQDRACGGMQIQHERQFPHRIVKLVKKDEDSDKDFWGHVKYNYKCWFEDSITASSFIQGYL